MCLLNAKDYNSWGWGQLTGNAKVTDASSQSTGRLSDSEILQYGIVCPAHGDSWMVFTRCLAFLISDLASPDFFSSAKLSDLELESQENSCGLALVLLHACVFLFHGPGGEAWLPTEVWVRASDAWSPLGEFLSSHMSGLLRSMQVIKTRCPEKLLQFFLLIQPRPTIRLSLPCACCLTKRH